MASLNAQLLLQQLLQLLLLPCPQVRLPHACPPCDALQAQQTLAAAPAAAATVGYWYCCWGLVATPCCYALLLLLLLLLCCLATSSVLPVQLMVTQHMLQLHLGAFPLHLGALCRLLVCCALAC
jgi:hypothetical protein